MRLTLNKFTALHVLRTLRAKRSPRCLRQTRVPIAHPSPEPAGTWSCSTFDITRFEPTETCDPRQSVSVAVPSAAERLRIKNVTNTVYAKGLPALPAMDVGNDLSISSPELLFVETAPIMTTPAHVLLGYELCGNYARDAVDPRNGTSTMEIPPITSVERIAAFMDACTGIRGLGKAREDLMLVANNAWSPFESIISTVIVLPIWEYGYMLGTVTLNKRVWPSETASWSFMRESRVPDILIDGSPVGINYDGGSHLDLDSVAQAAAEAALRPDDWRAKRELEATIRRVRAKVIDDNCRNRELGSQGLFVVPVTKEDLYELNRFEKVVLLILDGMEHRGIDVTEQRSYLVNRAMRQKRQELVWSLLPGRHAREHEQRIGDL